MQPVPNQIMYPRFHMHCTDLGSVRKLVLSGRLDVRSVEQIETRFFASAVAPGKPVVIDMRGVEQVACMAVGMLTSAARVLGRRKVPMVVISNEPILGLGWSAAREFVSVVSSEREALARLNS